MAFDGNTPFTLQVHVVKHLALSHLDGVGSLQQTVSQGRLTVVYMCYDAEVPYIVHLDAFENDLQRYNKKMTFMVLFRFFL
jgi:hypothetical protein